MADPIKDKAKAKQFQSGFRSALGFFDTQQPIQSGSMPTPEGGMSPAESRAKSADLNKGANYLLNEYNMWLMIKKDSGVDVSGFIKPDEFAALPLSEQKKILSDLQKDKPMVKPTVGSYGGLLD